MKNYGEALTHLKKARTWMLKGLKLILNQIDEGEAEALNRRKDMSEIVLMPKSTLDYYNKIQPKEKYWLTKEQAFAISEAMIEAFCRNCKRESCSCEIRTLFHGWEIPGATDVYEECEYREGL